MSKLKAASIVNNIQVARELVGETKLADLLATLPPETQAIFARRVLPIEWLETDEWLPFQQAMLEKHFAGNETLFRRYMYVVCERDFNTFYRVVIRLLVSPESLLERTAKLWSEYADSGKLVVAEKSSVGGRRRVCLELSGLVTKHAVFGIMTQAFVERLLPMAGAKNVEVARTKNQIVNGALETDLVASYG